MHTSEDFVRLALAEFPELAQELEDEMFPAEVAILDLGLPVMDGFELARRIVSMRADLRPRLVALTGYGREGGIARTRAVGFDTHLVKPVSVSLLLSAIDRGSTRAHSSGQSAD